MNFQSFFTYPKPAPLHKNYLAAGAVCSLSTNSRQILAAAGDTFIRLARPRRFADISMRFWVDSGAKGAAPWPQPYFRGLSNFVFAAFDPENSLLIDLRRRHAVGRFTESMVRDREYWRRVIFPTTFGIISGAAGIAALHCACVERDGRGFLLAGDSGSGKSTLSLALALRGFSFLADDWTYLSRRDERLLAWGLATPLKLLPEAIGHFPELASLRPDISLNGELAYEVHPEKNFGVRRSPCAEPHCVVFLERDGDSEMSLTELPPAEASARLEQSVESLPLSLSASRDDLIRTVRILVQRPCWQLRYSERPEEIAQALSEFFTGERSIDASPFELAETR